MIPQLFFISVLLAVSAQEYLGKVPRGCSVPKSPPTCMNSTATPYFKSCGIYGGGDCSLFCHSLQAQYWARHRTPRRCFRLAPSLIELRRLYAKCLHHCAYAKERIRKYRLTKSQKTSTAFPVRSTASKVMALIYISVNGRGFVTSRAQVYTRAQIRYSTNKFGGRTGGGSDMGFGRGNADTNICICSTCQGKKASCPKCCKFSGHTWV